MSPNLLLARGSFGRKYPVHIDLGLRACECYCRLFCTLFLLRLLRDRSRPISNALLTIKSQSRSSCIVMACLGTVIFLSGCQTLAPFSQTMRTRVAAARQWTGSGLEAFRRGAVGEARTYFNKASSQLPEDQDIIANVARTHFEEGQYHNAITELKRAIKIDDGDAGLTVELGEYLLADGQIAAASEQARKALGKDHRLACAWLLSGRVHAASGNERAALGDFQKATWRTS